ncbi:MarR family winged helix-turn-helix transcriptional regulator [Paenibacillus sp. UNC451MF]|uniref:MarR family winged helix-turn-helix transcriptional regulator n=1 Tax=Paenibacillus sp. UNC451MF TaxID=1449063 RepID=UPI00069047A4|nr:MarR family transcriptional regulator [Paenibacillus sp. UNC451MF]
METVNVVLEELEETSRRIMRRLVSYSKHVDRRFSGSQVSALQTVEFYGSLKVSQLAECLSLSSSAVTLLCDKLIHNGYLQRERSFDDRRVVCLVITESGKEMLQQLLDKEKEVVCRWLTGLSAEEMRQFSTTLNRITENVKNL